jgi:hypothetical protein
MANVINTNPITIDAEGVISVEPVIVKLVRFIPANTGDQATFTYWIEGTPDHESTGTATWSTLTCTSTGNFPAGAPAVNDIVWIHHTSTGNNEFHFQTATAGNNNAFVADAVPAHHGTVTDEENKTYFWKIWTPKTAFTFNPDGTVSKAVREIYWGPDGMRFPNLAMHTLSGGSTAEIFLK